MIFRKLLLVLGLVCTICGAYAQELNCTVTVNSDQVPGSNKSVFNTLQSSIEEYINQNRWTNMTFATREKIDCSMMIIVKAVADNLYTCEMQLQSRRPVYNTSYTTPLINFKDNNFNFTYQEFERIEYQQNQFTTNLTAMLAYYCYLVIGYDMDSYSRLGGTPYFQTCEDIVSACQSASMESLEQKGWQAFDSNRNRYALINNLMDEAFRKGVEMTMNQFNTTMEKLGVTKIDSLGEKFDPALHNAVMHVEDEEKGENEIVEVFQEGFRLGDKVIRFAMVKVAN